MLQLQEKKKLLENATIEHNNLIQKCKAELSRRQKEKGQLPKKKKIKCLYCNKLFKNESFRDEHIRDKHGYPDYFICCYCGIKLVVE